MRDVTRATLRECGRYPSRAVLLTVACHRRWRPVPLAAVCQLGVALEPVIASGGERIIQAGSLAPGSRGHQDGRLDRVHSPRAMFA
jgi:hypothetical protein